MPSPRLKFTMQRGDSTQRLDWSQFIERLKSLRSWVLFSVFTSQADVRLSSRLEPVTSICCCAINVDKRLYLKVTISIILFKPSLEKQDIKSVNIGFNYLAYVQIASDRRKPCAYFVLPSPLPHQPESLLTISRFKPRDKLRTLALKTKNQTDYADHCRSRPINGWFGYLPRFHISSIAGLLHSFNSNSIYKNVLKRAFTARLFNTPVL
jgi:hypothetical protein